MKILACGAHPDDIEYGCGGLLSKLIAEGHEVFMHVITDGGRGGDPAIRKAEQEKAAEVLGVRELIWGGFSDTELKFNRVLIENLENIVNRIEPDMVLVNSPCDAHQDHEALGKAAVTVCRYIKRVLFYHDYTTLNFNPSLFVDITDRLELKRNLILCHKSQVMRCYPTGLDLIESVNSMAAYFGFMAKVRYAEAFEPLRFLFL